MRSHTIHTFAKKPDTCHACGYTAEITTRFRIQSRVAYPYTVEVEPIDGKR